MQIANTEMAAAWDGPEGEHWTAEAERYNAAGKRHWERFTKEVPVATDDHVLDIGCGTGWSTRELARLASGGSALGIDLSSRMLEHARQLAAAEGIDNVRFVQGDAQVHAFEPARHDLATSEFGAMFFGDPVAAFANIGRALRPGGRIALMAWQEFARNEWVRSIRDALAIGRPMPDPPANTPGPFGLAGEDHVRRVLGDAGFRDVELQLVDEAMEFGRDADDAYEFLSTGGITRGLTQDLDEADRQRALDALRRTLVDHETPNGVLFDSAAWLITAGR